ncbi:scoloptoxin SSD14-like [Tachypleus tridentatus]|uniref:scoloptoxin SSD14-like n=1 Tax=Tachypleus tridentatus TaxID=6853 RepID=UPI003FD1A1A1
MRRPVLAQTLRTRSQNSIITNFFGELEETLPEEIRSFGGIVTMTDFLKYTPHWEELVRVHFRNNLTLYSVPPPGSGSLLGFVLNILNDTSFPDPSQDAKNYHRLVETFKHAFSKLSQLEALEDGDDSFKYKRIKNNSPKKYDGTLMTNTQTGSLRGGNLSHVGHGNVSTFHSCTKCFGSKKVFISTGIIFNNAMNTFTSLDTSDTNGFPTSIYNKISPEKRELSSMSPTIVVTVMEKSDL